jgi:hypothetical protein
VPEKLVHRIGFEYKEEVHNESWVNSVFIPKVNLILESSPKVHYYKNVDNASIFTVIGPKGGVMLFYLMAEGTIEEYNSVFKSIADEICVSLDLEKSQVLKNNA